MQLSAPAAEPPTPATPSGRSEDRGRARGGHRLAARHARPEPRQLRRRSSPRESGTSTSPSTRTRRAIGWNDYSGTSSARRRSESGREFRLLFTIDTLTGASASGAVPAGRAQTFTSPSGKAYYIDAGRGDAARPHLPRHPHRAGRRTWRSRWAASPRSTSGLSVSNEWDYLHTGVNATFTRDFNERRTTLALGAAFARDTIDPEGGAPLPLAAMLPVGETGNKRRQRRQDGRRLPDRRHPGPRAATRSGSSTTRSASPTAT